MSFELSSPVISVIIPVFNRESYIKRALESLLAQDFDQPFEIVVIDDGSTDKTAQVIESVNSEKVNYFFQANSGASSARRLGIAKAKANIVCFLDSDDIACPNFLFDLWKSLTVNQASVMSYGLVRSLDNQDRTGLLNYSLPEVDEYGILSDPLCALLEHGCFTISMNLMTYKDLAMKASEGREAIVAANDYDFCLRLATEGSFSFTDTVTILIDRLETGIGALIGHKQVAFAILNACSAVKLSGRNDPSIRLLLSERIKLLWPSAIAQLLFKKEYLMSLQVFQKSIGYLDINGLKRLYWALSYELKKNNK